MKFKLLSLYLGNKIVNKLNNVDITAIHAGNSNSNRTFIALYLPSMKGDSKPQQHQDSQPISVSRDRKEAHHHREDQGFNKTKVGMPRCVQISFMLLSEGGRCVNLITEIIPNIESIKSKVIAKWFKRLMSRRGELLNNMEITTTLTVPCKKKGMEQNTLVNLCKETCNQVCLF